MVFLEKEIKNGTMDRQVFHQTPCKTTIVFSFFLPAKEKRVAAKNIFWTDARSVPPK
jgi:hypothetical protein